MTRTPADIGRGLAAARPARPIATGERIHVVGAGGAGASAAALLAHHVGATVTGCDPGGPSPYTAALEDLRIPLAWEHSAAHVEGGVDRLAVTKALTAVNPDHPELAAARSRDTPLEPWQQVVADAAAATGQRLVAIAGTHGKSTTTGWLVDVLVRAGRDPSAFVGALLSTELTGARPSTARWGKGPDFVVEADEYAGNFDPYRPDVIGLLNVEWDHPDVFADEDAVVDAFVQWIERAPDAFVVVNPLDRGARRVLERIDTAHRVAGLHQRTLPAGWTVGLAGPANRANARMVVAIARGIDVPDWAIRQSLAEYPGVGRRMEVKGDVGGVVVIDDYGHHPTAIEKTLAAVRSRYRGRRVWAVYEPLTFHRTAAMLGRFASVLARADEVAIADIWAGRDPDTTITSAAALASAVTAVGGPVAVAPGSVEATADYLVEQVRPRDVVLVMGGGRSYVIADRLIELLRDRAS